MNQIDRLINIALGELNYTEGANGYTKYGNWYGMQYGYSDYNVDPSGNCFATDAWCAAFVAWCANRASISTDIIPCTASCPEIYRKYTSWGRIVSSPQRGDLILIDNDSEIGPDHVGIVTAVTSSYVYTIEGNYGDTVCERSYPLSHYESYAYCRPEYNLSDAEDPDYEEFGPDYTEFENYTVVYGDTLGEIAVRYGFTVSELLTCNDISNPNILLVGQIIKIPLTGRRNWITLFQQAINSAGIATLSVTGTWNTSTEAAAANAIVQSGTSGPMATFAQTMLLAYGYSLPMYGADGDFGSESIAATVSYQNDHNLVADGIIGLNTWKSMLLVN